MKTLVRFSCFCFFRAIHFHYLLRIIYDHLRPIQVQILKMSQPEDIFLKQLEVKLEYPEECAEDILNHPGQDMKNVNCNLIDIKEEFKYLELENKVEGKYEDTYGFVNQRNILEDNKEGDFIIKTDEGIQNDCKCADIIHLKQEEKPITDINYVHIEPTVIVAELNDKSVTSSKSIISFSCDNLIRHTERHHHLVDESKRCNEQKQRPECYHCGDTFFDKRTLVHHMRRHTGERPYSCSLCGARFRYSSNLIKHGRCHTGERPYKCDQCDAKFAQKYNLTIHMKSHIGGDKHQCRYCKGKFAQKAYLVVHERIHTNDRPYRCEKCIDRFTRSVHLKKHTKTHTNEGPYMCSACKVGFNRKVSLNRHLKIHALENASDSGRQFSGKLEN